MGRAVRCGGISLRGIVLVEMCVKVKDPLIEITCVVLGVVGTALSAATMRASSLVLCCVSLHIMSKAPILSSVS
jgi:hypothetical protein